VRDVWPGDAQDFDAFMRDATSDPSPATIHAPGHRLTRGGQEWGDAPWRLGSGHVLDLEGGTLELDVGAVTDDVLKAESPIHVVPSAIGWAAGKTDEEAWASVPVGEGCRNGTIVCNHSKVAERAKALGVSLRISGVVLQGHSATIEGLEFTDCGALKYESFPATITGALSGPDRHALSTVNPQHMFDEDTSRPPSEIRNVSIGGFVSHASDAQVSCFMIVGATTNDRIADPWAEVGNWGQIYRRRPAIRNARGVARDGGENQFQLATIYQCRGGEVDTPFCRGFQAGIYGDYLTTYDLDVHHGDLEALRPVAQLLSPTPMPLAAQFSSHRLLVRSNQLKALPTELDWHAALYLNNLPPYMDQRVIEDVMADDNDFIMVGAPRAGNVAVRARGVDGLNIRPTNRFHGFRQLYDIDSSNTDVVLPPAPASRRGCGRWFR
jgi:hypothetical protein